MLSLFAQHDRASINANCGVLAWEAVAHRSRLRNRVISRVFRELGLIEQWGSGIQVILEQAASQHLPPLLFEEVGPRFRDTLPLATQTPLGACCT